MGGDAKRHDKRFEQAILAIQETLHQAERQLTRLREDLGEELGKDLQFLIGADGDVEIARRSRSGGPVRPKVVVAVLKGTDPMLWRADHPRWLRALAPRHEVNPLLPKEGNGQPATNGAGEEENGGSTPPASTDGRS